MNCENAQLYYYDGLQNPQAVPANIKEHLETCIVCREQMQRLEILLAQTEPVEKPWRHLRLHYQLLDQWLSCDQIRPFLPLLLVPGLDVIRQTPVTAHIDHCPTCQKALREIAGLRMAPSKLVRAARYLAGEQPEPTLDPFAHAVLDRIRQGGLSDVMTRMQLTPTADKEPGCLSDAIRVEVKHRNTKTTPRRAVSVCVASGVAAAILFVVLLLLPTANLKALDVEQLYATVENVRNVHIQKFDGTKELENIWISQGLGACLFQQGENMVFVDGRSGKIFQKHQGTVRVVSQGGQMELEHPWGLLPFRHLSDVPASYDWNYVSDAVLEGDITVRVYEWSWTETRSDQVTIKRIWRGYLDSRRHLPYRIECIDQIGDAAAQVVMEMKISYPSDEACLEVFERHGFGSVFYGDQAERLTITPVSSKTGSRADGFFLSTWPSTKAALSLLAE